MEPIIAPCIPSRSFNNGVTAVADLEAASILRDQIHSNILQVSEAAVTKASAEQPPPDAPMNFPLPLTEVTLAALPDRPQTATHKLVGEGWDRLARWSQTFQNNQAPAVHLPWLYMLMDFVLTTDCGGVRPVRKYTTWEWLSRANAKQYELQERVRWFRIFLLRIHKTGAGHADDPVREAFIAGYGVLGPLPYRSHGHGSLQGRRNAHPKAQSSAHQWSRSLSNRALEIFQGSRHPPRKLRSLSQSENRKIGGHRH